MALADQSRSSKGSLVGYSDQHRLGTPYHRIDFQFNPTSIRERREAVYNFSEAQGQLLPQAQFGRVGNTEISFELFMFNHEGIDLKPLRGLTLPKQLTNLTYYTQAQPDVYHLILDDYGDFIGVVTGVDLVTEQYHKKTLKPIHVKAQIKFVQVSLGATQDLFYI